MTMSPRATVKGHRLPPDIRIVQNGLVGESRLMGLVFQLISAILSLTFMLLRFTLQMLFMMIRGIAALMGAR